MSLEDQAALLGSECERWLRADVRAPLWIPPRYAALRPLGAREVLDVLDKRRAVSPRANGTLGNLNEVVQFLGTTSRARLASFLKTKVQPNISSCGCCVGYAAASGAKLVPRYHCDRGASSPPKQVAQSAIAQSAVAPSGSSPAQELVIAPDAPFIQFDQDTWQTTVTESLTVNLPNPNDNATLERVRNVLRNSSPERWAFASKQLAAPDADPFFKASRPGMWSPAGFEADNASDQGAALPILSARTLEAWKSPTGGQLEESTSWNSGGYDSSASGALIYLTIKNYAVHIDNSNTPSLSFDYVLHHCASYISGPLDLKDILDVDGGHFEGTFEEGQLRIVASKSIHFRAASQFDQDAAVLLNLLAPATTAMLMRELVYEGALTLLNAPALSVPGPKPSPLPSGGNYRPTPKPEPTPPLNGGGSFDSTASLHETAARTDEHSVPTNAKWTIKSAPDSGVGPRGAHDTETQTHEHSAPTNAKRAKTIARGRVSRVTSKSDIRGLRADSEGRSKQKSKSQKAGGA